ncbi:hypothetical protein HDU79_005866 [Rhizoclosmatium sp. JEL0117]|nr:hypothetical protein HDU79_005866 [Rhizoclosmatium sp. JEL0117]
MCVVKETADYCNTLVVVVDTPVVRIDPEVHKQPVAVEDIVHIAEDRRVVSGIAGILAVDIPVEHIVDNLERPQRFVGQSVYQFAKFFWSC